METTRNRLPTPPCNRHRKVGPGGGGRGTRTLVGPPHDRLRLVSSLVGLGLPYGGVSAQLSREGWLLHFFPLRISKNTNSAPCFLFSFYAFSPISGFLSAKHIFFENKRSKVNAYVLKDCLFLLFWTIIGGSRYAIVTVNS
jgi:hypothetical protein